MKHSIEAYKNRLEAAAIGIADQFYWGYREDVNRLLDKNRYPVIIAEWPQWELTAKDSIVVNQTILIGAKGTSPIRAADALQDLATLYIAAIDNGDQYYVQNVNESKKVYISPEGMTADSSTWLRFEIQVKMFCAASPVETARGYGLLYNGLTIENRDFAPIGWTVMGKVEWDELFDVVNSFVGGLTREAGMLKADSELWPSYNEIISNKTEVQDFKALPNGYRESDGTFRNRGTEGYWWYRILSDASGVYMGTAYQADRAGGAELNGYSVRMVYNGGGNPGAYLTDPDGNKYNIVKIGDRYYIDSDYRCRTFINGNPIDQLQDAEDWSTAVGAAYCEYE